MDKLSAITLIKDTLQNSFNKEVFLYFVKNLLNHVEETPTTIYRGNLIPDAYKSYIQMLERICKYHDPKGNKIDVLIVHLKKETSLEQARTMQRNFIALYLNGSRGGVLKDAAIVAFVSPDEEDWRFSFVKMEYRLAETPTGKIKAEEEFTPARRYSYLVGKNENSHTAQSRLLPLLIDDKHNPLLNEIEDAFSIEKVTKEFFEKYSDLFMRTKKALDEIIKENEKVKNDFLQKGVNTVDFSKKLLGQIVFLYFLQKKGWFGVARDASWGTGPKNFLRLLFEKRLSNYQNFFNDILEPLFYNTLAVERTDDYSDRFNCKIPFLNGGLFDPINSYDWVHTDVLLPDELFSNDIKTKEGDIGTGILDVFDRYNFTVKEDEPLEKEVAVDPEMLGKVFENLLEVKDRKSKGTYYTPREIVHYMCQESLINYLDNVINTSKEVIVAQKAVQKKLIGEDDPEQLGIMEQKQRTIIPKEDIESFIRHGISAIEHDRRVEAKGYETRDYSYRMPDSIRLNARLFDNALQTVKICDPAVGSGAFLVGMMHEIIRARETLTTYFPTLEKGGKGGFSKERTPYNFKHHAIQNCLYGVDIDQGAVEIAKLRLWLSLMVDEEDIKHIKPLPNLDYKIVCGNSLLGINDLFHHAQLKKLEELKGRFFEETNSKKKSQLKEDIDYLIREITHNDQHFDFKVYFSEVFHPSKNSPFGKGGEGGFDIVIANPPYVEHKKLKGISSELKKYYSTYSGTADLYVYFYENGIKNLRENGTLIYITSNKFIKTSYGENLRKYFTNFKINEIIDFTEVHIFEALVASCIFSVSKSNNSNNKIRIAFANDSLLDFADVAAFVDKNKFFLKQSNLSEKIWQLENETKLALKEKIENGSVTMNKIGNINIYRGVTTGYNPAFIIDDEKRKELIKEDKANKAVIKPMLQGRNIKKWNYIKTTDYLIFTRRGIQIRDFPSIKRHLQHFKEQLEPGVGRKSGSYNWYEIQDNTAYYSEFEKEKIIWGLTADKWAFAYDNENYFLPSNGYILTSKVIPVKYLLALMNSKLMEFYFGFIGIMTAGGAFTLKHETVIEFPIKNAEEIIQQPFITLVDQILALKQKDLNADTSALERQIDEMVYKLYDLTGEEIKIVEGIP